MHHLPPQNSALRDMFSIEHDLVPIGTGQARPALMRDTVRRARAAMADNKAIAHMTFIVMAPNDDLVLIQIGCRGGVKPLWNFTTGKRSF